MILQHEQNMFQHLSLHCNFHVFSPSTLHSTPSPTFTLVLKTDGPGMFLFDYFSPDPAWLGSLKSEYVAASLDLNIKWKISHQLSLLSLSPLLASN